MISRSFLSSSIVFTVGGALPMLAGIILLPFYTNYLDEKSYTQLLFYINVSLLFQIFFSFSTESYFGVQFSRLGEDPDEQKKFTGTVALFLLLLGSALLLILSVVGDYIFKHVYNDALGIEFWPYGFFSVLTGFFNSYFKTSTICLIYVKKSRTFLISNIINFVLTIGISTGGLLMFPHSVVGPIYGRLLSGVVIFMIAHFIYKSHGTLTFKKEFMGDLVRFCAPYMVFVVSSWVLGQGDRNFMQGLDKADLNAYDLMLKCFFGIEFLQNSLSAVIFPKLFEIWNKTGQNKTTPESNRYFNVFSAINIIQLVLFCIFIPIIYRILIYNKTFFVSENYIGILAAGYVTRGIINYYVSTILFTKKINVLVRIFVSAAVIQLGLTWIFVKQFGINGAIYAGLLTKVLQVVFCMLFTKNVFEYNFNALKILIIPLFYFALNVAQYFIFPHYNVFLYLAQLLIFSLLFYFIFRNEIVKTIASLFPRANA